MTTPTRRAFLGTSALTLSAAAYARAADKPNDKVRIAVMGVRNRGRQLLGTFLGQPDVEVTHLIDPDENVVPAALAVAKKQATPPKVETDVRKVLEDQTVTALVVAAPDHWHALATVWACQAGKHVYCEKPLSHNLVEGRRMVAAARKHNRVVQTGTQRRSADHVIAAREYVAAGKLGKVPFARTWIAGNRPSIGHKADAPVPKGVDYGLWTGPAPEKPFNPNRFHYEWHWFWEYGTGELGNNGIHGLDLVRNVLRLDAPTRVASTGGKYFYDDDRVTPDTQVATFDFPACTVQWEHRIWAKEGLHGQKFGVALYGEKGTLLFTDKGWDVLDGNGDAFKSAGGAEAAHAADFLARVKDGKRPTGDVEEGHKSATLCHLGNIAFRTGTTLHFDAATESFAGNKEATALLGREYRKGFELPAV